MRMVDDAPSAAARGGDKRTWGHETLWLRPGIPITSAMIVGVIARAERSGSIAIKLAPEGAAALSALSEKNIGRRMALLIDGEIVSAPTISAKITDGRLEIDGFADFAAASALADKIQARFPCAKTRSC